MMAAFGQEGRNRPSFFKRGVLPCRVVCRVKNGMLWVALDRLGRIRQKIARSALHKHWRASRQCHPASSARRTDLAREAWIAFIVLCLCGRSASVRADAATEYAPEHRVHFRRRPRRPRDELLRLADQ